MNDERALTVSDVARLSGVTVRTLHHYDAIGLLCPTRRSSAGYRLYGEGDLAQLQQILLLRELGMALEQIRALLKGPGPELIGALRGQRRLLERKVERLRAMMEGLEETLSALQGGRDMDVEKAFKLEERFDNSAYAEEAEARWGETDAFKESARRTKGYRPADWAAIKAESEDILTRLAASMTAGSAPTSEAAMDLAEAYRAHIDRWYYPCSHAMQRMLAQGYLADDRFAATFNAYAEGLTPYLVAAIEANAERAEAEAG